MPAYQKLPFDLDERCWTFLRQPNGGFTAEEVRRSADKNSKPRQLLFESELRRIAAYFASAQIPLFLNTPAKGNVQFDRGCVGHAIANNILEPVQNGASGKVEELRLVSL